MTLKEVKENTLALIEELNAEHELLTEDPDIAAKINPVINQIMHEIIRIKKIPTYSIEEVASDEIFDLNQLVDFYQLKRIKYDGDYEIIDNMVQFSALGTATFFYYKYPERITKDTSDNYEFELSQDCLEILPYGVAADMLKSDVSTGYGKIYADRYESMLQRLDPRHSLDKRAYFEGGVDI